MENQILKPNHQKQEQQQEPEKKDKAPSLWSQEKINQLLGLVSVKKEEERQDNAEREVEEEIESEQGIESPKRARISANPFVKMGLIGAVCCTGAFFVGLIFLQFASFDLKGAFKGKPTQTSLALAEEEEKSISLEEENAQLKAELALSDQEKQLKALKEKMDAENRATTDEDLPKLEIVSEPSPSPEPVAPVRVQPTRIPPSPTTSRPVVQRRELPRLPIRPAPTPSVVRATTPPPVKIPTPPAPRPSTPVETVATNSASSLEKWQQLSALGSYRGSTSYESPKLLAKANSPTKLVSAKSPENEPTASTITKELAKNIVAVGQLVKAELVSPLLGADGVNSQYTFMVKLSEPILDEEGAEVAPKNTLVVFNLERIHGSGLVMAEATSILKDGQKMTVPSGAIALWSKGGEPLVAKQKKAGGDEVAKRNLAIFALGALGKVGEISNRATSSSNFSSFGGYSSSTTYGDPNYLGAVLEGGLEPLVEEMQQTNSSAIAALSNRPYYWFVEVGTDVELLVNNAFSL